MLDTSLSKPGSMTMATPACSSQISPTSEPSHRSFGEGCILSLGYCIPSGRMRSAQASVAYACQRLGGGDRGGPGVDGGRSPGRAVCTQRDRNRVAEGHAVQLFIHHPTGPGQGSRARAPKANIFLIAPVDPRHPQKKGSRNPSPVGVVVVPSTGARHSRAPAPFGSPSAHGRHLHRDHDPVLLRRRPSQRPAGRGARRR